MINCPRCSSQLIPAISQSNEPSTFFLECPHCNTFVNTWQPQPQQYHFLQDSSRFKGNFGAYGSAKTSASIQNALKHILITPNGTGLIGANILPQLEQTIKREFDQLVPKAFIQEFSNQKSYYTFVNGYRLLWRPMDDAGKLRSLNLDMVVFVEGSEIDADFWATAKTRLRNMSASTLDPMATKEAIDRFIKLKNRRPSPSEQAQITQYAADWREQWVESNPDAGWVKQDVLIPAARITLSGDPLYRVKQLQDIINQEFDQATSVHIASTSANAYLPKDYIKNLSKNKPQWWINRFVLSSFEYAEGLVYPAAITNAKTNTIHLLTQPPTPPQGARFILAHDYGLSDPAGILLTYIDPTSNHLVIYKEYKEQNMNIRELATQIKKIALFVPQGAWLMPFIIDPKTGPKRDYQKQSLIDLYAQHGIHFKPASTPAVEPGIYKLNTYFEDDRILISPECPQLKKELETYSFKQARDASNTDTPEDKNNHLLDPLRWIVMELPSDPNNLSQAVFNSQGQRLTQTQEQARYAYDALNPTTNTVDYIEHHTPSTGRILDIDENNIDESTWQSGNNNVTISQRGGNIWNPLSND